MVKDLKNISNTQQAFWIALASLVTFSFGILSAIVLSRYLSKSDYGTYSQVLFIYSTLLVIFTLGLPKTYTYFLPRIEIDQARHAIKKITNIFFIIGAIFSLLLYFSSGLIADLLRNNELEFAIKVFSPVPFFMLPTLGIEGIFSCYRQAHLAAIYTICTRVLMLICIILPVILFETTYIGALVGFTIASFLILILALYLKYLPLKNYGSTRSDLTYKTIFSFSLPLMIASIWGIIEVSSSQFFISRYFGPEAFAEYSVGAIELPLVSMVLGATSSILSPIFSRMSHEKINLKVELYPLWNRVFEKSAMLTYPLLAFSIIFSKDIIVLLFGVSYVESAVYFQIFNIYCFFTIITCGPYLINTGRHKLYANAHMYSVLFLIPFQFVTLKLFNSITSLIIVLIIIKIFRTLFFLKIISNDFGKGFFRAFPMFLIFKIIVISFFIGLSCKFVLVNFFKLNSMFLLVLGGIIYLFAYIVSAFFMRIDYFSLVRPLLSKRIK